VPSISAVPSSVPSISAVPSSVPSISAVTSSERQLKVLNYKESMESSFQDNYQQGIGNDHEPVAKLGVLKVEHKKDVPKGTKILDSNKFQMDGSETKCEDVGGIIVVDDGSPDPINFPGCWGLVFLEFDFCNYPTLSPKIGIAKDLCPVTCGVCLPLF